MADPDLPEGTPDDVDADAAARDRRAVETAWEDLAHLLETRLGAHGDTLAQRLDTIEEILPEDVAEKIRFVETVRDLMRDEDGAELADRPAFDAIVADSIGYLEGFPEPEPAEPEPAAAEPAEEPEAPEEPPRDAPEIDLPPRRGGGVPVSQIVGFVLLLLALALIAGAIYGIMTVEPAPEGGGS